MAYRSFSSGTAEVATKTVASWSYALDAPNEDRCGLFDVCATRYDQCGPLDAPNDNQCAPNETVIASPEASATAVGVSDDATKRFGRSALLDAAAAERAGLRDEKNEGVACPPWWLPPFMANHGQVHSGNQVLAHVDVDDGMPHRDLMSHRAAEPPKPADSPSPGETIGSWISSALLCAFVFLLSAYAFNGKDRSRKKGAKAMNRKAHSPEALQLQVTGTGRTTMVDASPTMTAARLSRVIEKQTGVPQGSFTLYYGSRPMRGTLNESGVASGSTIELKFRGRGGGSEPPATNSSEVEIEVEIETRPASVDKPPAGVARGPTAMMRGYDRDGDGNFSRDEVRAMAADFIKEKKTRRLATKAAIAMGVIILLVVGLNAGLTAAIVFLSKDVKVVNGVLVDPSTNERLKVSSADTTVAPDGSLRDQNADSVSVSTHTQKNVYAVKLVPSQRRLDEQGSGSGNEMMVAQVACKNVLAAIASIEHGDDTGLVRIEFESGDIWMPSLSAANYRMQNDSFRMEQISLSGHPETLYDVVCETTRLACDTNPGDLCDVVISSANPSSTRRALSFEEAFDGDLDVQKISDRRRLVLLKAAIAVTTVVADKAVDAIKIANSPTTPGFKGGFGAEGFGPAYTLMNQARSWSDASAACLAEGLQLASVHSAAENDQLHTAAAGNVVWIGGTDAASEGEWKWSPSGSPLSYTNWNSATNEPNDYGGGEDCVEFYQSGKWNDNDCARQRKFVCQSDPMGDWMHWLGTPDNTNVTSMLIPGTHDTMALYGGLDPFDYAVCQDLSLWDQLNAGIRAVDIRVQFNGCLPDEQEIYHGPINQQTNWPAVKQTLEAWITSHPTEFVLVFVKNENTEGNRDKECNGKTMYDSLKSSLDPSKWYIKTTFHMKPTYGDYKGRLVWMQKWTYNTVNGIKPEIQSKYYTDVTFQQKWEYIVEHEAQTRESGRLYINFLSAVGLDWDTLLQNKAKNDLATPAEFAQFINERAYDQIEIFKPGSELPYSQTAIAHLSAVS